MSDGAQHRDAGGKFVADLERADRQFVHHGARGFASRHHEPPNAGGDEPGGDFRQGVLDGVPGLVLAVLPLKGSNCIGAARGCDEYWPSLEMSTSEFESLLDAAATLDNALRIKA